MSEENTNLINWEICNVKYEEDLSKRREKIEGVSNYEFFNQIHQTILQIYLSNNVDNSLTQEKEVMIPNLYVDTYVNNLYRFMEYSRSNMVLLLEYIYGEKPIDIKKIDKIIDYYEFNNSINDYTMSFDKVPNNDFYTIEQLEVILSEVKRVTTAIVKSVSSKCMSLAFEYDALVSTQIKTIIKIFNIIPKTKLIKKINNKIKCMAIARLIKLNGESELVYSFNSLADIENDDFLSLNSSERKLIIDSVDNHYIKIKVNKVKLKKIYTDISNQYPFSEMKLVKTNRNQLYIHEGKEYTLLEYLKKRTIIDEEIPARLYSCAERKIVASSVGCELQIDYSKYKKELTIYTGCTKYPLMLSCALCYDVLWDFINKSGIQLSFFDKEGTLCDFSECIREKNEYIPLVSRFKKHMNL